MGVLFNFEVHTPYRLFFFGKAQTVILTLTDGEICVYAKHSALIAPVVPCTLRFKDADDNWRTAFISDGILQVKEYKYVLMVNAAEWPEEIDKERAIRAKEQAEKDLGDALFKFEQNKSRERLRRANSRLKVLEMFSG